MGAKYTAAQAKATKEYLNKFDEVKIRIPKGQKAIIKDHAEAMGENLNKFVFRAILETMERDKNRPVAIWQTTQDERATSKTKLNIGYMDSEGQKRTTLEKKPEHLAEDGELPWRWYNANERIFKPHEDAIKKMGNTSTRYTGYERIRHLEKMISYYYDFKEMCYNRDECFKKYFQDTFECGRVEYIKRFEDDLRMLKG